MANMAPVLFKRIKFLNYPVDFNYKWRGKPLFGSHKTLRGFFFGTIVAIITAYLQKWLFVNNHLKTISILDYSAGNILLIGFLLGFGALLGDLIESFFKRRSKIKPGKPWIPWDQLDFVIGALVLLSLVYIPEASVIVFLLVAVPILHLLVNYIGYCLKIKKNKW